MRKFTQKLKRFKKKYLKSVFKTGAMRLIIFYQKHISGHTCLYQPTCSEYTLQAINNRGLIIGILAGVWRILRCNPFSKGGYDPAPEKLKYKWVL